jgi:molybdate transport system regulatory protein
MPRKATVIRPRIRVTRGDAIVLGPGKADLLAAIAETGSIRSAARKLGMSYMRAWSLVQTMNESFRTPLVEPTRGGARHGAAELTKLGARVLALYREMEERAEKAIGPAWKKVEKELK